MAQPEVIPTHLSGALWAQLLWWSAIAGSTNAVGCGAVWQCLSGLAVAPGRCPGMDHNRGLLSPTLDCCAMAAWTSAGRIQE